MYKIDIPIETKKDIVKGIRETSKKIYTPIAIKKFLIESYYRYVEPMRANETFESKCNKALSCMACFKGIVAYFKMNLTKYEEEIKGHIEQ